jgi:hypothetical protein
MHQSTRKNVTRHTKTIASSAKTVYRHLDQAGSTLGKWVVTDHTGLSQSLLNMPFMGFWASCRYILINFLITLAGVFVSGILLFLLITFGLPWLITGVLS